MSEYRLIQDDMVVAKTFGPEYFAKPDIDHYALIYSQDGDVIVQEKVGKRWKVLYGLIHAPKVN